MIKKNKYMPISIFLLCILLLVGTIYYFLPLKANNVFFELENLEKIVFVVRFDDKKDSEFVNVEIRGKEMDYFSNLLNMTMYRRAFGKTNIQSQAKAYDILIVHNSNNYSIVINDGGYVLVEGNNSKKKYKILSSKKDALLKLIDEMLMPK